jgi:hypothetical protein
MSVEQFIAILAALTSLTAAVGVAIAQLRQTHALVNSRMSELLAVTKSAAHAQGVLDEKGMIPPTGPSTMRPCGEPSPTSGELGKRP